MLWKQKNSKYWWIKLTMNGKCKRVSTKCEKKSEAIALHDQIRKTFLEAKRRETVGSLLGLSSLEKKPLPLSLVWQKYVSMNDRWSESGRRTWEIFRRFSKYDYDIADVTTDHALSFLEAYRERQSTHNIYKSQLSKIWQVMRPYSSIKGNPWKEIANLSKDGKHTGIFSNEDIRRILEYSAKKQPYWHDMVVISLNTGLRKMDANNLQWTQIKGDYIELTPSKTKGRSVQIPIRPAVQEVLERRKGQDPAYVFKEWADFSPHGVEFTRKVLDKLKILPKNSRERIGFHALRATFISRCEEQGVSRTALQGIVGHGSPLMTERYSEDRESAKQILKVKI